MENMLDLMKEPVEVQDSPTARPLIATKGKIEFRNVSFAYSPERPILKNLSFVVEPGQTFAIVSTSVRPGTNVMIFEIFSPKIGEKIG
jgi:ABC-type transport system involved in Fe-S cluster assembly fused permease/ATPase subunit